MSIKDDKNVQHMENAQLIMSKILSDGKIWRCKFDFFFAKLTINIPDHRMCLGKFRILPG